MGIDVISEAIIRGARTEEIGDGKIIVLDLCEVVRIGTGERGGVAIGWAYSRKGIYVM